MPVTPGKPIPILLADDDPDDRLMIQDALRRCEIASELHVVPDGQALLDYLRHNGSYSARPEAAPRPGLILLDLNMPRKNGRRALEEIKGDPILCKIPVIIFTTSGLEEDVINAYSHGANSFITKPVTFDQLVGVMQEVTRYWFETVTIPPLDEEN